MIRALCVSLFIWASVAHAVTLDQLQQRFASQPVLRADFTQTRTIKDMAQPLISHGELLIAQQQGLWWHQASPFTMTLLLNDKRMSQTINNQPAQIITADTSPQMFQFNHLLRALFQADMRVLNENFLIDFQDSGNDRWQLVLKPKAAPLNKIFNRIALQGAAFLGTITLDDKQGDTTRIVFSNQRIQPVQLTEEERARFARP